MNQFNFHSYKRNGKAIEMEMSFKLQIKDKQFSYSLCAGLKTYQLQSNHLK